MIDELIIGLLSGLMFAPLAFFHCCCTTCTITTDDFNRSSVGAGWTAASGSWSIPDSLSVATSSSDAILLNATSDSRGDDNSHVVDVKIKASDATDEINIGLGYADANNYVFAQVVFDGTCGTIELFERTSGTTTSRKGPIQIGELALSAFHKFRVCLSYITADTVWRLHAYSVDSTVVVHVETDLAGTTFGDQAFIGTGTMAGTATFDDFTFSKNGIDESGCPACAADACIIATDNFTRANNSNPGCLWDEVAGDWDISSNQLYTTTSNNLTPFTVAHPDSLTSAYITVTMSSCGSGSILWVLANYVDSNNYHAAKITLNSSGYSLALVKRTGGVNTTIGTNSSGSGVYTSGVSIIVCMTNFSMSCSVNGILTQKATTAHATGYRVGLGNGTVNTSLTVDDFVFAKHYDANNTTCNQCVQACSYCDSSLPAFGQYRIDLGAGGWTDDQCSFCDQVAGEFILEQVDPCKWEYYEYDICPGNGCLTAVWWFRMRLTIEGTSPGKWTLTIDIFPPVVDPSEYCGAAQAIYESATLADAYRCQTLPVTLSSTFDASRSMCNGTLPATITLEAV